ncbi:hypothetical protein [Variovorax sp. UMC13]|uniref:hypothetical protein n=1 Tax=Variovorax sp. UMC13 TaxID=1862326 RepID=UPI0016012A88|nr:hypothetical protein [Variovorax sp. UMC13]MBB1601250.1 hypothetical protein [Variovorax sp. UMC13]
MIQKLIARFHAWREARQWEAQHIEWLRTMVHGDARWLASNPIAAAITARYEAAVAEDWYARPHEDVSQLRTRLGIDPGARRSPAAAAFTPRAVQDVAAERVRQMLAKGWTYEHDDEHVQGEIAALAAYYAMPPAARDWPAAETGYGDTFGQAIVPSGWEAKANDDRRRELVKAGALVCAEIERLDRAEAPTARKGGRE